MLVSSGRSLEQAHSEWPTIGQVAGQQSYTHPAQRPLATIKQATHHQRTMTERIRRPSPMQARGRSNTLAPNNPDGRPLLSVETGRSFSSDKRPVSLNVYTRDSSSGSIKNTLKTKASRLLRRQESHDNLTSLKTIDWSDGLDDSPWGTPSGSSPSSRRDTRKLHSVSQSEEPEDQQSPIRHNISLPFDFRHLTHTNHNDVRNMQDVPTYKLQSDFSTLSASEVPIGELRGIRAETIPRHDVYPETSPPTSSSSSPTTRRLPPDGVARPSPQIPARPEFPWGSQEARHSSFVHRFFTPPLSPLEGAQSSHPIQWHAQAITPTLVIPPHSPFNDVAFASQTPITVDLAAPHAVTTPDEAAQVLRAPPFEMVRTELSRVIEEDEISERRSSIATLTRGHFNAESNLRHVKSFPSSTQALEQARNSKAETYRQSIQCSPKKQRRSFQVIQPSFEDVDGDVPYQARVSRRDSATVKDIEGDWNDVIDWCYHHEAEADCNFDFTRAVSPTLPSPRTGSPTEPATLLHSTAFALEKSERRSSSIYSASPPLLPALPQLCTSDIPDLQPSSAVSAQSSFDGASEVVTPSDTSVPNLESRFSLFSFKPNNSKPYIHHSPHVSNDHTSLDFYETLCQETYARGSWHYGRADGSTISSASPRSSRSRISKSSSQESFSLHNSRRRSNNNSQGSLPELTPPRVSRENKKTDHYLPPNVPLNDPTSTLAPASLTTPLLSTADDNRRKSPTSLVKDVAQKNLLSKLQAGTLIEDACSAQVPLPLHPALRSDANVAPTSLDASTTKSSKGALGAPFAPLPPLAPRKTLQDGEGSTEGLTRDRSRPALGNRKRSASSAERVKTKGVNISPRASCRASYGIYPAGVSARR